MGTHGCPDGRPLGAGWATKDPKFPQKGVVGLVFWRIYHPKMMPLSHGLYITKKYCNLE
jgi:hypothetical protein